MNHLLQSGRRILIPLAIFSLLIVIAGCEDPPFYHPPKQPDQSKFDLLVVDAQNTDISAFPVGTDIKIVLRFISDESKNIDNECQLFNNKDFFLVFKLDESNPLVPSYYPVGTPYQYPINCSAANVPSSHLFGSSVVIALNWSANPNNLPLPAGKYYTVANFEASIEGKVQRWDLKKDFEVY